MNFLRRLAGWLNIQSVREYELLEEIITLKERIAKKAKKINRLQLQLQDEQAAHEKERRDWEALEAQLRENNTINQLEWEQERRKLEVKIEVQKAEIELWEEVNERNRVRIEAESAKAAADIASALATKPRDKR